MANRQPSQRLADRYGKSMVSCEFQHGGHALSEADLDAVERQLGRLLPSPMRQHYLRCNDRDSF